MTNKIKEVKHQSQTNYFRSPELLMHTCFKTHLLFCNLPLSDSELAAYVSRKTMTSEKLIEATRMLLFPYSSSCKLTLKCCYDHNQVTVGFLCVLNEYLTCQDSKLTVVKVDLVSDSYCSYQPKFKHHSKCQWEWFVWLFSFFSLWNGNKQVSFWQKRKNVIQMCSLSAFYSCFLKTQYQYNKKS